MRRLLCLCLVLIASLPMLAQDPARMDQIVKSYFDKQQFMGSVLVAREGKVLFRKSYGFANMEWQTPFTDDTKFRLGSVTKQFTAAGILLLEERGKLSVQDPVKKYLPDAPAAWDKITIHHVLTHTSGIPNFTSFPDYGPTKTLPSPAEKTVKRFWDKPLDFEPGSKWSYSNSGYVLLSYLIEKVSGMSYADFVAENIFKPLGLGDTGYDSFTRIIPHRASGYAPRGKAMLNAEYVDMTIPSGAGALYSTTGDLQKWIEGLLAGKLLSPASVEKMTTPFKDNYAYGLDVRTANGHKQISHGGGIEGFNTFILHEADTRVTTVVLANLNGPAPGSIARQLTTLADGGTVVLPAERKEVTVPATVFGSYAGDYQLTPAILVKVTVEDGRPWVQLTGQPKLRLFAASETVLFVREVEAEFEFVKDASGKVTSLLLRQNGAEGKCPRVK